MIPPAIFRHALEQAMTDRVELLDATRAVLSADIRAQIVAHRELSQGESGGQTIYTQLVDVSMPANTDMPAGVSAVYVSKSEQPALVGAELVVLAEAIGAAGGAVRALRCQVV